MTPQNINHLIDAITEVVSAIGISGIFAYILYLILKNVE
nr:MAG TPA: hypothetical protein [Caudoviricetes sp.]